MAGYDRREVFCLLGGVVLGAGLGGAYQQARSSESAAELIRPPGAGSESSFLAACIRCGLCVQACPHDTLKMSDFSTGTACATPYADDMRQRPCYLCQSYEEPLCIRVCPTEALSPVEDLHDIRMGIAVILEDICWAYNGTMCKACWHACPWPDDALSFDERLRPVITETCVGCGICVHACPTDPVSIVVQAPKSSPD